MVLGLSLGGSQRHSEVMESPIPSIPSVQFSLESSQTKCHEQSMGSIQDAPKLALWLISMEASHCAAVLTRDQRCSLSPGKPAPHRGLCGPLGDRAGAVTVT